MTTSDYFDDHDGWSFYDHDSPAEPDGATTTRPSRDGASDDMSSGAVAMARGERFGAFLAPANRTHRFFGKTYRVLADSSIDPQSFGRIKYFNAVPACVELLNVENLAAVVADAGAFEGGRAFVRACLVGDGRQVRRKLGLAGTVNSYIEDAPSRVFVLDIDGFDLPDGFDVVRDPEAAVAHYIKARLPEVLWAAGFVYKHSSSAGLPVKQICAPDGDPFWIPDLDKPQKKRRYVNGPSGHRRLSGHLFMILDKPVTCEWLKRVMRALTADKRRPEIDPTSNGTNQLLWLSPPKFVGMNDPIERRIFYCDGPEVSVDDLDLSCQSILSLAPQVVSPPPQKTNPCPAKPRATTGVPGSIQNKNSIWIDSLRERLATGSHYEAIKHSVGSYDYFCGLDSSLEDWKAGVRAALASTERTSEHRAKYESDGFLDALYHDLGAQHVTAQAMRPVTLRDPENALLESAVLSDDSDAALAAWERVSDRMRPHFKSKDEHLDFHVAREVAATHTVWATAEALVRSLGGEAAVCAKRDENNGYRYAVLTAANAILLPRARSPRAHRFHALLSALSEPDTEILPRLDGCVYEGPDGGPVYPFTANGWTSGLEVDGLLLNLRDGPTRKAHGDNSVIVDPGTSGVPGMWSSRALAGDTDLRIFASAQAAVRWLVSTGAQSTRVAAIGDAPSPSTLNRLRSLILADNHHTILVDEKLPEAAQRGVNRVIAGVESQRRPKGPDIFGFDL